MAITVLLLGQPRPPVAQFVSKTPPLVVLTSTGQTREGLPVFTRHPDAAHYEAALARGFSGRLLQLYRLEQQLLSRRDGSSVEPAYLLLSDTQGGFPRVGFWLDGDRKANVAYVDLFHRQPVSGQFGAMDQIFPHELMHVILHQLARTPPPGTGGANQVHAIGVRTDRVTAFDEGLAEHVQVLAIDDPDALPETRALVSDVRSYTFVTDQLGQYRRALEARVALAPPMRLGFVLWFSHGEQVLRYQAVKANLFAREIVLPDRLLVSGDPYAAYLLESVIPGSPDARIKTTSRLLDTEGVVALLFSRWAATAAMQAPADRALYDRFGASPGDLAPLMHAYLKLFAVFADRQPRDVPSFVRGYVDAFPRERDAVARLFTEAGFTWPVPDSPEIWLANDRFTTGTTLFDQYRAMPRTHTFDLNAASLVDLVSVDGVSLSLANAILRRAPYATLEEVTTVTGVTPEIAERFRQMALGMTVVRRSNASDSEESVDLMRIFAPVIWRAILYLGAGAVVSAWLYGRIRRLRPWRLMANGLAASAIGLLSAWLLGAALQVRGHAVPAILLVLLPVVVVGVPAALWQLARARDAGEAGRVLAAWAVACVPGVLIVVPWL